MTTELGNDPKLLKVKPHLKKAIYSANMRAHPDMIEGAINLFKKHNIKWVPGSNGTGVYVPGPLLSVSKGKNKDDLGKRVKEVADTITAYLIHKGQPKPFMKKLTGTELDNFKQIWNHYVKEDLGKINSLWVVDWSVAYLYLSSGLTKASLTISTTVEFKPRVKRTRPAIWPYEYDFSDENETDLVAKIAHLSLYQKTLHLTLEETVENIYKKDDNVNKTRRFDLVIRNYQNRDINHVEFKLGAITIAHVHSIVGERNYLDLIRKKYRGRSTSLIFSSPHGCTPEALRYIKSIRGCSYMDTQDIINMVIKNIEVETPKEGWWFYIKEVFPRIFLTPQKNILSFPSQKEKSFVM